MKSFYYPFLILSILTCMAFVTSCSHLENSNADVVDVPDLIDRNEKIQLGKEWDYVRNVYVEKKNILTANPKAHETKLDLAELFIKEARVTGEHGYYYPAALQLTDEVIDSDPENRDLLFRALTVKAGVLLSQHEFDAALTTATEALSMNRINAQVYGAMVDALVELGQYDQAVAMADQMMQIKPDIRSYSRVAYLREIYGDIEGSIEAMHYAVDAGYPGYEERAWAMLTLGELYTRYGRHDQAEEIFNAILLEREDYPFAVAALGKIYENAGDEKKAEASYMEAIGIIPEVGFYIDLAHLYKRQHKSAEVDKLKSEILVMLEDDVVHGHNMNMEYAQVYLDLFNQDKDALEFALKEYKKRPDNIDVNKSLARIYHHQGKANLASEHLIAASRTGSRHPELESLKMIPTQSSPISSL